MKLSALPEKEQEPKPKVNELPMLVNIRIGIFICAAHDAPTSGTP
jgi:hypothetical protein